MTVSTNPNPFTVEWDSGALTWPALSPRMSGLDAARTSTRLWAAGVRLRVGGLSGRPQRDARVRVGTLADEIPDDAVFDDTAVW